MMHQAKVEASGCVLGKLQVRKRGESIGARMQAWDVRTSASRAHLLSCMRLLLSYCVDHLPLRIQGNTRQLLNVGRVCGTEHDVLPPALGWQKAQNLFDLLPA